jgi:hypothetical protein
MRWLLPEVMNTASRCSQIKHCRVGALSPCPPPSETNAISIGAGSTHSLVANADGSVQLLGSIIFSGVSNAPPGLTNVAAAAYGCGAQHALVIRLGRPAFPPPVLPV